MSSGLLIRDEREEDDKKDEDPKVSLQALDTPAPHDDETNYKKNYLEALRFFLKAHSQKVEE